MGSWLNHYTLYSFFSLFTLFLYIINPIFKVHNNTLLIFLCGTIAFNLSILLFKRKSFLCKKPSIRYLPSRVSFSMIYIVCILLIPLLIIFKNQISGGMELWLIRKTLRTDNVRSVSENMSLLYFITPLTAIITIISYYKYNFPLEKAKYIFIISIILVVIQSAIDGGGRSIIMQWFYIYIIAVIYKKGKFKWALNNNAKFKLSFLAIPVIAGIIMTLQRGVTSDDKNLIDTLTESFTIYIGLFDYFINSGYFEKESLTLGISSFENIYLLINLYCKTFFGINYLFDYSIVDNTIQDFYLLNNNQPYNAYVSMYFRFLRDWGGIGIIIGPFILSSLLSLLYKMACKDGFYVLIYMFCLSLCTSLNQELVFSKVSTLLFLIYMVIIHKVFLKSEQSLIQDKLY